MHPAHRNNVIAAALLSLFAASPAFAVQYSIRLSSPGLVASTPADPTPAAADGPRLTGTLNFSNCGNGGRFGPTLAQCTSAYSGQTELLASLAMPGNQGYQEWTVPSTGNYTITVAGAGGGKSTDARGVGGKGAILRGSFDLTQGTVLQIVVGQPGIDAQTITYGSTDAGGGGGTFVVKKMGNVPLLVAGGGGGGNYYVNGATTYYGSGGNGGTAVTAANPPASVNYNSGALNFGAPGAGFAANAAMPGWGSGGFTVAMGFGSGAVGGISTNSSSSSSANRFGGFGGGSGAHGASCIGGGAGGGYAGGLGSAGCGGGGDGSSYFDSGASARSSSDGKYGVTTLGTASLGYVSASTPGYVTIAQN